MRKCIVFGVIALVFLLGPQVARPASDSHATKVFDQLKSSSDEIREKAKRKIAEHRNNVVQSLVNLLRQSDKDVEGSERKSITAAIELLGLYRAAEASEILTEYMDFPERVGVNFEGGRLPDHVYPAIKALIEIGRPAIPIVIDSLKGANSNNEVLLKNSVWVVANIEGFQADGFEAAKFHLEYALRNERNPDRRAVMEEMIKYIDSLLD